MAPMKKKKKKGGILLASHCSAVRVGIVSKIDIHDKKEKGGRREGVVVEKYKKVQVQW